MRNVIVDNQLVNSPCPKIRGGDAVRRRAPWTPTTTGSHNFVLRAYDNQGQSDASLRYSVQVFDNQPPVVTAMSEYPMLPPGDVLLVNALAFRTMASDAWNCMWTNVYGRGEQFAALAANCDASHALCRDLNTGTHSFYIRAYDVTGQKADTQPATIEVREGAPHLARGKGTAVPTRTPFPPTPTPTPQSVLPGPPTIELALANAPVVLPGAAQIRILARGSSELDHVEVGERREKRPRNCCWKKM